MLDPLEADMRERIISLKEENKRLKTEIKYKNQLWKSAKEENKRLKTEIKQKNQLWKSAFRAYKNLKKIIMGFVGFN